MTNDLHRLLERFLHGDLTAGDLTTFQERISADPELRELIDRKLVRSAGLLRDVPDSIWEDGLLSAYVEGEGTSEERRRVELAQESDPVIADELGALYALRTELQSFRMPEPSRPPLGFWQRVATVMSIPPLSATLAQSFASREIAHEDWRRIAFPIESRASGAVRFENGMAIVSVQSQAWTPGVLVRARVRGVRTGEEATAVGVAEADAVPCAEFILPIAAEQPVEVTYGLVDQLLPIDEDLVGEIWAASDRAVELGGFQAHLWHEWASRHIASENVLIRDLALRMTARPS